MVASLAVVLLVSGAIWVYIDQSKHHEVSEQAGQSLDSGIALFNEKKYLEAIKVFESISPGSPGEWRVRYYQGSSYIWLKDYKAAAKYLELALRMNPTNTGIMHSLGVISFKQGNLKLAKAYYVSILEINPNDEEAKGLMNIMTNQINNPPKTEKPESEASIDQ